LFIREHAPSVLSELSNGLSLVTVRCSCNYLAEVLAFDEVLIRMRLASVSQNGLTMAFDYIRRSPAGEELVARAEQQIACMRREGDRSVPTPVPVALREALKQYSE
jgi:enediyne biosynthesis thioesterase